MQCLSGTLTRTLTLTLTLTLARILTLSWPLIHVQVSPTGSAPSELLVEVVAMALCELQLDDEKMNLTAEIR